MLALYGFLNCFTFKEIAEALVFENRINTIILALFCLMNQLLGHDYLELILVDSKIGIL